ncbi:hypothetical protein [Sediminibacillus massiliensis]|nr:hypothetical protein [Sediminibacillus massiliensis]
MEDNRLLEASVEQDRELPYTLETDWGSWIADKILQPLCYVAK